MEPEFIDQYVYWDDPSRSSAVTIPTKNDASKDPPRSKKTRRQQSRRGAVHPFDHLVSSAHDNHSARELCDNESSHGPDFFSMSEGVFCDMHTKTHWPLCKGNETECYHWDTHSLIMGQERRAKNHTRVEAWD